MAEQKQTRFLPIFVLLGAIAILCAIMWGGQPPAPKVPTPANPVPVPAPQAKDEPKSIVTTDYATLQGYVPNPEGTKEFVATLPAANLTEASPGLFADTPKVDAFPYQALLKVWREKYGREFVVGKQGIGDCVSWGWAHGIMVHQAVNYYNGDTSEFQAVATESIYGGSRVEARGVRLGGYSDGSYGGAAAKWVRDWGVIYRQEYDSLDLTAYSSQRAKDWGNFGNGGRDDQGKLDTTAKDFPCGEVTLVRNFDEAAVAIASGYPVPVCSQVGFVSTRDANGFARASGSWAHCMCFIAVRYNPDGLLCLNSWGPDWISGPKYPDDMPEGSFWVDRATVDRMLRGEDSFAVSKLKGFPFRPLDHTSWARTKSRRDRYRAEEPIFALAP